MNNVERMIGLGNTIAAFAYAAVVLAIQRGSPRVRSDLVALLSAAPWHPAQAVLVAAPIGGAIAWWVLLRWWRRRRAEGPQLPSVEVAAAAIGASLAAVSITAMTAFVLVDLSEVVAEGIAPGLARRLLALPLATVGFALVGLLASPVAALWSLPVILVGGPLNAFVSLQVLRWTERRAG